MGKMYYIITLLFSAAAQEAQESMPTFINLPPPYSEQPSPLYNLSSDYYCCHHHYQHLCFNPEVTQDTNKEDTHSTTDTTTDTATTTSAF